MAREDLSPRVIARVVRLERKEDGVRVTLEPTPGAERRVREVDRLLRPACKCPRCGRAPALRVYARDMTEGARIPRQTYQCCGCGKVYTITEDAYRRAA